MAAFVGLVRAVNVGGTGKLAMTDLKAACEAGLHACAGKPMQVILRTACEMTAIVKRNPFPESPPNHVMTIFLDNAPSPADLAGVTGRGDNEELHLGSREIYVRYGAGMANSRRRFPAANVGTARNMNTVAKLAAMVAEL